MNISSCSSAPDDHSVRPGQLAVYWRAPGPEGRRAGLHAPSQIHGCDMPQGNHRGTSHFFVSFYVNHLSCNRPYRQLLIIDLGQTVPRVRGIATELRTG